MADYLPATYDWPSAVRGDTFNGVTVTGVTVDGANPTTTLASTRIHFRSAPSATPAGLQLTSSGGNITISSVTTWACQVSAFSVSLTPGVWYYDWEFTDSAGAVRTYLAGKWRIAQDCTR